MNRVRTLGLAALLVGLGAMATVSTLVQAPAFRAAHAADPSDGQGVKDQLRTLASLWNAPAPSISASLVTAFTPNQETSVARIGVVLAEPGSLYVKETDGTTTLTFPLFGGATLNAFQAYTCVWPLRKHTPDGSKTLSYTFTLGATTNGSVPVLRVDEVLPGVD